jgi:hypothetical protein
VHTLTCQVSNGSTDKVSPQPLSAYINMSSIKWINWQGITPADHKKHSTWQGIPTVCDKVSPNHHYYQTLPPPHHYKYQKWDLKMNTKPLRAQSICFLLPPLLSFLSIKKTNKNTWMIRIHTIFLKFCFKAGSQHCKQDKLKAVRHN